MPLRTFDYLTELLREIIETWDCHQPEVVYGRLGFVYTTIGDAHEFHDK